MNIFIRGDGKKIDLDLNNSRVVAVQKTNPLFSYSHGYSILIKSKECSYFVSSKNYSRKSWTGIDTATDYLYRMQLSYDLGFDIDTYEEFKPIFVKQNNLKGGDFKKVKRIWVKRYRPEIKTHRLPYYYTQEQQCSML